MHNTQRKAPHLSCLPRTRVRQTHVQQGGIRVLLLNLLNTQTDTVQDELGDSS